MAWIVGTHSGRFHADDVLAVALLREFVAAAADAEVLRTRDLDQLARCDAVVDVGGVFDPERRRFDHHQADYSGPRSSAGMVLDWLEAQSHCQPALAEQLRAELVDYVDDVDNGRRTPDPRVPCFTSMVGAWAHSRRREDQDEDDTGIDARFLEATVVAQRVLQGIRASFERAAHARGVVLAAMQHAAAGRSKTIELPGPLPWKHTYFEAGGARHATEFVLLPAEGAWRILAIPPEPGSFANKRSLPAAWAGLTDADMEQVSGIPGARFCHKNRFIAVFATRQGALRALAESFGTDWLPAAAD